MAVFTSAQLRSAGGNITRKARFNRRVRGRESTYSIILRYLDEFHDNKTPLDRRITLVSEMSSLIADWMANHGDSTNRDEVKRKNALSRLLRQLMEIDWTNRVMRDVDYFLDRTDFSNVGESGIVLRENNSLTKKITELTTMTGAYYARLVLADVVNMANETPNITRETANANKAVIEKIYKLLMNNLLTTQIPDSFAKGAKHIADRILTKTNNNPAAGYNTLVNYVFLRLLNPFLTTPVLNQVVQEIPGNGNTTKTLVILSMLIQRQANRGLDFVNPQMNQLSYILSDNAGVIESYLINNVYKGAGKGKKTAMDQLLN